MNKIKYTLLILLIILVSGCTTVNKKMEKVVKNDDSKVIVKEVKDNNGKLIIKVVDVDGNLILGKITVIKENKEEIEKKGEMVKFENLSQGLYTVKTKKEGYRTTTKYFNINGELKEETIQLKKDYPHLTIIALLNGEEISAKVEISKDGEIIGTSQGEFLDFKLDSGIYQAKVSGPYIISTTKYINMGSEDEELEIKVRRGTTVKVGVVNSQGEAIKGTVKIKKDDNVIAEEVGENVEFSKLSEGMYEITAKTDNSFSTTKFLFVKGMILEKKLRLRMKSKIKVITYSEGKNVEAEIKISKSGKVVKMIENEEAEFELENGIYEITASGDNFETTTKYVNLKSDSILEIEMTEVKRLTVSVYDKSNNLLISEVELKKGIRIVKLDEGGIVKFDKLKKGIYEVVVRNQKYKSVSNFILINDVDKELKIVLKNEIEKK